ncbi:MAG TPA: transcription-repair coupling factor [Thermoanaerobaculia bacterium]|nr:transcription-repair coupling factor [Thermoanaerobaculia bacterium]
MSEILHRFATRLRDSPPYQRLREVVLAATRGRGGQAPATVCGLPTGAAAFVLETLAEDLGRPLQVLVPHETEAREWATAASTLGGRGDSVVWFPAPTLSPYQEAEVPLSVRAQEVAALDRIFAAERPTIVATPRALQRRLPSRAAFLRGVLRISVGEEHPLEMLIEHLARHGYRRTDLVTSVGEFAVRGGVFDLFPPGCDEPLRLDLFGDVVDSIRPFDAVSQRSSGQLEHASVLPLDLFPRGDDEARLLGERLADRAPARLGTEAARRLAGLREGETYPGWENLLPLLAADPRLLIDSIDAPLVVAVEPETLERETRHHAESLESQYRARLEEGVLAVAPGELVFELDSVLGSIARASVRLVELPVPGVETVDFQARATDRFLNQLPRFPREVETARARGETLVLVAPGAEHARVREALRPYHIDIGSGGVELASGEIERGFRLPAARLVVFAEEQLFPRRTPRRPARDRLGAFFSGLRDLKVGDFVVHTDHGIGQVIGLRALPGPAPPADSWELPGEDGNGDGAPGGVEVMEIAYAEGKSLLLPLARLDQIQRYSGIEGVAPRLDRLGGSSWQRTKSRVRSSVRDMAKELLKLYAERQLAEAPAMFPDSDLQRQLEAAFEFDETDDQLAAAEAIKRDLERPRPMDRLLCGDVGFGKTEVAMRAAFKVVDSGYQVALLAPTTILADQHLETFRRRMADFPVRIDMVSRFRSAKEVREIAKAAAERRVDILVGTHRLLQKDLEFPRLGLVIIDEEQRFGVAQKEKLKQLRQNVHVLAMSATPVPRTLQLSIAGVRDLSLIESPPKDRMAVETQIVPYSKELIKEAIAAELERGGQVYYVYNQVETIERMSAILRELHPGLRITVGHGQMDERELARRMHAFTAREYDVLVASTIIENGIDIPNVNTMIVHRADRFGLAQLYQLRGRVGRSHHLAYCYLLVPEDRVLPADAQKRLAAIREFTELGAGFRIAARDLEIRGAGNLLGAEQSGHIAEVGIETYLRLLEETVRELKGELPAEEAPAVTIDLPLDVAIPDDYVPDQNLRMGIYRRLGSGSEPSAVVLDELGDRFGPPPESVRRLAGLADLKRLAESLRVQSITGRRGRLVIRLRRDARVDVQQLIRFVSDHPEASFSPNGVLSVALAGGDWLGLAAATLQAVAPEQPVEPSPALSPVGQAEA